MKVILTINDKKLHVYADGMLATEKHSCAFFSICFHLWHDIIPREHPSQIEDIQLLYTYLES